MELDRPHLDAGEDPGAFLDIEVAAHLAFAIGDVHVADGCVQCASIMTLEEALRGNAVRAPKRGETLDVQLAIYVDESNAALAAQLEREWIFASVPGARDEVTFGPADGCPGCGEPLAASATACASCGLEFPPLEIACPRCGRPVAVEAESCGECGFRP